MTDVDSKSETQFNVRASTTFVGATQALVSLTPTKSGSAAFLAVADTETIPSVTSAETLLAYREIDFSGTSAQIIQFALSIRATQDATNGEVSGGTGAVLQPSTAYKIVVYRSGSTATLLTFTTLGHLAEGYTFGGVGGVYPFDMSAHNFRTGTDGRFQVPFVFSWVQTSGGLLAEIDNGESGELTPIGSFISGSAGFGVSTLYNMLVNHFGDQDRGGVFLHTPRSGAIRKYHLAVTNGKGSDISIFYN
ncbi:hypothetical protein P0082_09375 [Candidatus Haliotispira prima]|uniref:Uncharacterized protein n=1 Tax=Candidatus Haliotispira prima TaxID=3034016 RepID=A0ABY8MFI1_9SPIO|nr:hypothetical protein P0082_09375 [Candidatus Haliotispira prima]